MSLNELILGVIVLTILVGMALPRLVRTAETAIGRQAVAGLEQIRSGENIYRGEENTYWPGAGNAAINTQLRTQLDASAGRNWNYAIVAGAAAFTATATRTNGSNTGETITIDQNGFINYAGWTP